MNYAQIRKFDVSNGPNIRTTLFVSGCTNNCPGCFNRQLSDFNYGSKWTKDKEDEFLGYVKDSNIVGVNILGGDPMDQTMDEDLLNLLSRIKNETNKSIWLWSGYTYEEILRDHKKLNLLTFVDVLVDGRFVLEKRDLMLKYRGSSNQRVIDVQKSLKTNNLVEIEI